MKTGRKSQLQNNNLMIAKSKKNKSFEWYRSKSLIATNQKEAENIAMELIGTGRYKDVKVEKRDIALNPEDKKYTKNKYWVKVIKKY